VVTHEKSRNAVTVLTTELDDPSGYGRILRDENGEVSGIREQKDANEAELAVKEINSGIYAFDAAMLRSALTEVTTDNAQGEMYLTDVLAVARSRGGRVASSQIADRWQIEGANDRVQVSNLARIYNERKTEFWMRQGVTIIDPATTWIDATVIIGQDVTLKQGTQLHGETIIGTNAVVGPDTTLTNVVVGQNATVKRTDATDSRISEGASVGPFAYLRPGTDLGPDGKIGAFYETKNVTIGRGSKLSHLGYAGDAEIGEYTNIGCGNITANYDGEKKHRTKIGSHVRTSSNTVFIAPVELGDGAYTGAGAIVRKNVPAGALALSVAPQRNTEGWTLEKRPGTPSADAAFKSSLNNSASE
jgi:bifunctional UDP-N-acetylglucosamine pyrophosphorylase/glucosamine-1-phosphate N-acetyltransferase